jgi:hypothetical protein
MVSFFVVSSLDVHVLKHKERGERGETADRMPIIWGNVSGCSWKWRRSGTQKGINPHKSIMKSLSKQRGGGKEVESEREKRERLFMCLCAFPEALYYSQECFPPLSLRQIAG